MQFGGPKNVNGKGQMVPVGTYGSMPQHSNIDMSVGGLQFVRTKFDGGMGPQNTLSMNKVLKSAPRGGRVLG